VGQKQQEEQQWQHEMAAADLQDQNS
jgi:hypothetical protein